MNKWYQLSIKEVIEKLGSNIDGLSSKKANALLKRYGLNILPKKKKDSIFKIFISEFKDPIILLLIIAIILSFFANEVIDALTIIFIIIIDAVIGTVQEWNAEKSSEALQKLIKVNVKVIRDDEEIEIDSSNIVIGDIVMVEPGNKISADLRIIKAHNLTVDESILTGESINSIKSSNIINDDVNISDCSNMLFAGTSVITGRALAIVVETAGHTEIGKIAEKVSNTVETPSPLSIRMNKFSKQISFLIIIISIIITILLINKGYNLTSIFLAVIALSVSAMPEGLPLALTMALTIGSTRMAKKNVIVKKLNAVESLGSCTVIASDKTGTLTVNEQTAKRIVLPCGYEYDITGTGYSIDGIINSKNDGDLEMANYISELGVINNEAILTYEKGKWHSIGDSIDTAFLVLGYKTKVIDNDFIRLGNIPYESENKYSAVFYKRESKNFCTIKGSVEKVLTFCKDMDNDGNITDIDYDKIMIQNDNLAKEGYRVIAIADGEIPNLEEKEAYNESDINNVIFKGLVAFIDPIRTESIESINDCKKAGIKVVMITGDHPLTAFSIAKELNIANNYEEIATSDEISEYLAKGENTFDNYVKTKTVFTRVTPLQKLEIVNSYKRQNEFIAVTGDGVNDAPAIKAANIGIAMGSGTDVAKETASMIIIDDNFLSIVSGIKEGRNAYNNIRKITYYLISCGVAEVMFFLMAILFNMPMPLVAIQLLWLNVVTDGLQDLALSFEKEKGNIMHSKPRKTTESLFDKLLIEELFTSGIIISLTVFAVWYYLITVLNMEVNHARGYIMALMVFIQNLHVLNCRSESKSILEYGLKGNKFIIFSIFSAIMLQIIIMEIEPLSELLNTYSVPYSHMLILLIISLPIIIVMEIFKLIKKRIKNI